eukprot:3785574-Prymnesium_polylepis.1
MAKPPSGAIGGGQRAPPPAATARPQERAAQVPQRDVHATAVAACDGIARGGGGPSASSAVVTRHEAAGGAAERRGEPTQTGDAGSAGGGVGARAATPAGAAG